METEIPLWKQSETTRGREAQKAVSRMLNTLVYAPEPFVEAMEKDHRTLQQLFTGLCIAWLKHLAELPEGHYDDRNQGSVEFARSIKPYLDKAYLRYI